MQTATGNKYYPSKNQEINSSQIGDRSSYFKLFNSCDSKNFAQEINSASEIIRSTAITLSGTLL
jgi:hypothetical protein